MSEQPDQNNENQQYSELPPEESERYEAWMADHPDEHTPEEDQREYGPQISELEALMNSFEQTYSLEALHAITNITPAESREHPIREPARVALIPIVAQLNVLKEETNISDQKYEELWARYKILSRAVGMIGKNNNVDHTR